MGEGSVYDRVTAGFSGLVVREEVKASALGHLRRWLSSPEFAPYQPLIQALIAAGRWDLLLDSFYQVLPFGTGGRRGPVGVGPNRYNPWTLSASVQGHVTWMRGRFGADEPLHVVLAYDVRCYRDANRLYPADVANPCMGLSSRDFAEIAAGVYAANGVATTLLPPGSDTFVSTPELSYAIRHLGADGGLNISASHNPPDDNGGKFYNRLGGQEVPPDDEAMADEVDRVEEIRAIPYAEARARGFVHDYTPDIHAAYIAVNLATSLAPEERNSHVVFTGLHGTGDTTVAEVLREAGLRVDIEPTQATHDGAFTEVPFRTPNPEVRQSMDRAVALARTLGATLVMASDPDADRIGLVAREADGTWRFFNGNEIAALVTYWRLSRGRFSRPLVMKTEVTSEIVRRVAEAYGATVIGHLMVGFKYIGDGLRQLDEAGSFAGYTGTLSDFVVGVEESHGVLVTPLLRDKDAAGAALALAELASAEAAAGRTLGDTLRGLWRQVGYVHNELVSTVMRGAAGKARIDRIQASIRANPPTRIGGLAVTEFLDRADPAGPLGPIRSRTDAASRDVLVFRMGETARILLRPSGTEPKNKIYVEYCGTPGASLENEVPRVTEAARALALDFAHQMLARAEIELPAWALRVSDLVAIEQKQHLAAELMPALRARLGDGVSPADPTLQAWLDAELRPYGKDPRGLVADAVSAWCTLGMEPAGDAGRVRAAFFPTG